MFAIQHAFTSHGEPVYLGRGDGMISSSTRTQDVREAVVLETRMDAEGIRDLIFGDEAADWLIVELPAVGE